MAAQPTVLTGLPVQTLNIEGVMIELLDALRQATTLVDVNVAAGVAHEAVLHMRAF